MVRDMGNNKTVNVIRHLAFEDMASFTSVLQAQNIQINYIEAADFALKPDDLTRIDALSEDLLVVLGGPISVNDGAMFPFIEAEIRLLEQRIAADLPTLGICLGSQLIARAMGARVYSDKAKEIGWYDLALTEAGEQSALRYLGAKHCSMLHWHGETFDLPDDAVLLASSEICTNQAFSVGKNVLALQFHPEITQRSMEKWFIGHIGEIMSTEGVSVERLREDTRRYANQLEVQGELFFNSWLNEVWF
ncbi:Glutamine amidotransferase, class I [hydrothermal vent metagenome]|uniref:Glutamine amidotransferase, class I n=1 Tax=hydrothermal vent metagenome TaxID=652676 RepID=A0A3B0X4C2_9ZZZZ